MAGAGAGGAGAAQAFLSGSPSEGQVAQTSLLTRCQADTRISGGGDAPAASSRDGPSTPAAADDTWLRLPMPHLQAACESAAADGTAAAPSAAAAAAATSPSCDRPGGRRHGRDARWSVAAMSDASPASEHALDEAALERVSTDLGSEGVETAACWHQVDDVCVSILDFRVQGRPAALDEVASLVDKLASGGIASQAASWRLLSLLRTRAEAAANAEMLLGTDVIEEAVRICRLAADDGPGTPSRDAWLCLPLLLFLICAYAPDARAAQQRVTAAMHASGYRLQPAIDVYLSGAGAADSDIDLPRVAHAAFVLCLYALRGSDADLAIMLAAQGPGGPGGPGVSLAAQTAAHFRRAAAFFPGTAAAMQAAQAAMAQAGDGIGEAAAAAQASMHEMMAACPMIKLLMWTSRLTHLLASSEGPCGPPARQALTAAGVLEAAAGIFFSGSPLPVEQQASPAAVLCALYLPNANAGHDAMLAGIHLPAVLCHMLASEDTFMARDALEGLSRVALSGALQAEVMQALLETLRPAGGGPEGHPGSPLGRKGAAQALTAIAAKDGAALVAGGLIEPLLDLLRDDDDEAGSVLAALPLAEATRHPAARAAILPGLRDMLRAGSPQTMLRATATVYKAAGKPAPALRQEMMDHGIGDLLVQQIAAAARRPDSPPDSVWAAPQPLSPPQQGILLGAMLRLVALPSARPALTAAGLTRGLVEPFLKSEDACVAKTAAAMIKYFLREAGPPGDPARSSISSDTRPGTFSSASRRPSASVSFGGMSLRLADRTRLHMSMDQVRPSSAAESLRASLLVAERAPLAAAQGAM